MGTVSLSALSSALAQNVHSKLRFRLLRNKSMSWWSHLPHVSTDGGKHSSSQLGSAARLPSHVFQIKSPTSQIWCKLHSISTLLPSLPWNIQNEVQNRDVERQRCQVRGQVNCRMAAQHIPRNTCPKVFTRACSALSSEPIQARHRT